MNELLRIASMADFTKGLIAGIAVMMVYRKIKRITRDVRRW